MSTFHDDVKEMAAWVRDCLKQANINKMDFYIHIEGRTHDGELLLSYAFEDYSKGITTKGGDLDAVVSEHMRRYDWQGRYEPLCLPNVE
jgi:hypothetical protein